MVLQIPAAPLAHHTLSKMEDKRMITLIVSKQTIAETVPVGTIEFNDNHQGILKLIRTDELGKQLELAWQEIGKLKELPLTETRIIERDGEKIRAYGKRMVAQTNKDFPWAIYDYLEKKYRFVVDVKD